MASTPPTPGDPAPSPVDPIPATPTDPIPPTPSDPVTTPEPGAPSLVEGP